MWMNMIHLLAHKRIRMELNTENKGMVALCRGILAMPFSARWFRFVC